METKFTKGEWCACRYSPYDFGIYSDSGRDLALVRGSDEEAEANVKLIASAPKLLECLIDMLRVMELNPTKENLYQRNKIERAIREAIL